MSVARLRDPVAGKGPDAFRTISEVAEDLDLPQHVLRFWETRFNQIKPMKRGGGRRYYRPEDVDLLKGIRLLLYGEGFTIRGVQRLLKEKGAAFVVEAGQTGVVDTVTAAEMDPPTAESGAARPAVEPAAPQSAPLRQARAEETAQPVSRSIVTPALPEPRPSLTREARGRLEAALGELVEAKRLLDQVR